MAQWKDLHYSITQDAQGKIKMATNYEAVKTSIHNILNTFKGERVMRPQFASNLRGLLFENIDNDVATRLAEDIKETIERWDDRPKITNIEVNRLPDENYLGIKIEFTIDGYPTNFIYDEQIGI